jgi:tRNA G26 N,N-dimethylase Trm1
MPIESLSRIMARIKISPPTRPISVFVVTKNKVRKLDAIYGNTIEAKRRQTALKPYHPSDKCPTCGHIQTHLAEEWLGDFHNQMSLQEIRDFLTKATEN